jgi:hypothetical protein
MSFTNPRFGEAAEVRNLNERCGEAHTIWKRLGSDLRPTT